MAKLINHVSVSRRFNQWRHRRLSSGAQRLSFDTVKLKEEGYLSQCGQDKWLVESALPDLRKGVFVDIGAHDGVSFSNTCYLEKQLGWTGLAIEPMPDVFERLDRNRNCIKVNGCISANQETAKFRKITGYSEMLSGLVDQYDPRHLDRITREVAAYGGRVDEIEVTCYRLASLLKEHDILDVHYMNIDVEGAEYDILRSIDFDAFNVHVCGIENNYMDFRIPRLMKNNGFDMVAIIGDEFYVKKPSRWRG
jgi:FkbM family methyltransferase